MGKVAGENIAKMIINIYKDMHPVIMIVLNILKIDHQLYIIKEALKRFLERKNS
jgi:hypothetical protein